MAVSRVIRYDDKHTHRDGRRIRMRRGTDLELNSFSLRIRNSCLNDLSLSLTLFLNVCAAKVELISFAMNSLPRPQQIEQWANVSGFRKYYPQLLIPIG